MQLPPITNPSSLPSSNHTGTENQTISVRGRLYYFMAAVCEVPNYSNGLQKLYQVAGATYTVFSAANLQKPSFLQFVGHLSLAVDAARPLYNVVPYFLGTVKPFDKDDEAALLYHGKTEEEIKALNEKISPFKASYYKGEYFSLVAHAGFVVLAVISVCVLLKEFKMADISRLAAQIGNTKLAGFQPLGFVSSLSLEKVELTLAGVALTALLGHYVQEFKGTQDTLKRTISVTGFVWDSVVLFKIVMDLAFGESQKGAIQKLNLAAALLSYLSCVTQAKSFELIFETKKTA